MLFMFAEIIPEPVRGRLGFRSSWWTRFSLAVATVGLRVFVRVAPRGMRFVPHYRRAMKRVKGVQVLGVASRGCMGETPMPR
jgi:hypothetical protein